MTHPYIRAALGRERLNTLLADAEAARTARQARLHRRQAATPARRGSPLWRRAAAGLRAVLRDESAVGPLPGAGWSSCAARPIPCCSSSSSQDCAWCSSAGRESAPAHSTSPRG
jgi:hypothetical protein